MSIQGRYAGNNFTSYDFYRSLGGFSGNGFDFKTLENQLDCTRSFNRIGIIYSDGTRQWLVRPSRNKHLVSHVVVTRIDSRSSVYNVKTAINRTIKTPFLANEITSTLISCGAAVVTGVLTISAGAAIPLTAGASGIVAGIIAAGTLATAAQCAIGIGRIALITTDHEEIVTWLDDESWYIATSTALDLISLSGAGAGLKSTLDVYKIMKNSTNTSVITWLKSLSRTERKRITEEIIRVKNPGISNSGIKAVMRAGFYPKRYPSDALQRSLQRELITAMSNTSAFVGSAMTGTIRDPKNLSSSTQYVISLIHPFSSM